MAALLILSLLSGCQTTNSTNSSQTETQSVETETGSTVMLEGQPLETMTEAGRKGDDRVGSALEKR